MTTEQKLVMDLEDVQAIRIVCKKCLTAISYVLNEDYKGLAAVCPNCRETLWELGMKPSEPPEHLIKVLHAWRDKEGTAPYRLCLELYHDAIKS
jgi:hypothetical protein